MVRERVLGFGGGTLSGCLPMKYGWVPAPVGALVAAVIGALLVVIVRLRRHSDDDLSRVPSGSQPWRLP